MVAQRGSGRRGPAPCWVLDGRVLDVGANTDELARSPVGGVECDGTDFGVGRDPPNSGRGAADRDNDRAQRELSEA